MEHEFIVVDDLTKIYPDAEPEPRSSDALFGTTGSTVAFQVAFRSHRQPRTPSWKRLSLRVNSSGSSNVSLSHVALQPARCPSWRQDLDDYEVVAPTLIPDLLIPLASGDGSAQTLIFEKHTGWNAIWVEVTLPSVGVDVEIYDGETLLFHTHIDVDVLQADIPRAPVSHLRWFHHDCIADHYGVDMWSDDHWRAIATQMEAAASLGATSVMMPLWTPPLDVQPGHYRQATQLLGISQPDEGYSFDFSLARKWVSLAQSHGLHQVELPPFFTQWGATSAAAFYVGYAPGIPEANTRDLPPTFGWDTDATQREFQQFLAALIPAVREFIEPLYGADNVFWHMSDEPRPEHLRSYQIASGAVTDYLEDAHIIDALSDPQYLPYVQTPVVATSEIDQFRSAGVEPHWVYYCVSQSTGQANQFMAQSGVHHRIQGFQFYKMGVKGFLHWGLNFYYSQWSLRLIDPMADTDAGGSFPSGDPFIIYPGPDYSTYLSLRHRMIAGAWRDLALAHYAENLIGRERVLAIIDPDEAIDYDTGFPSAAEYRLRLRTLFDAVTQALTSDAHSPRPMQVHSG